MSLYEHRAAYAALRERSGRASPDEGGEPEKGAAAAADHHTLAEYRGYLRQFDASTAGRLVLDAHDDPSTVRARLSAAAHAEGKLIGTQQRGKVMYFWLVGQDTGGWGEGGGR